MLRGLISIHFIQPAQSPISLAAIFMEPMFDWLYFPIDWNTNNFGNQFAPGTLFLCDDLG